LLWPDLVQQAGRWLKDCYGWCTFGEAAEASPVAAAAAAEAAQNAAASFTTSNSSGAAAVSRPGHLESLYDCFMMALLQHMMQGPCSSSSSKTPDLNSNTHTHPAAAGGSTTAAGSTAGSTVGRSLNSSDWEEWIESAAATALAALVSTYDRPDVLARGLHILTQQQLKVDQNQAATTAAAAGEGPGGSGVRPSSSSQPAKAAAAAKKADKAAMGRALWLLEKIFLWRQQLRPPPQQQQQGASNALAGTPSGSSSSSGSAVAGGVCQLLLALSELLRPAANCSVEWRCGALSVMLTAVEDFMQQPTGGQASHYSTQGFTCNLALLKSPTVHCMAWIGQLVAFWLFVAVNLARWEVNVCSYKQTSLQPLAADCLTHV
jgi:hypothetical protein